MKHYHKALYDEATGQLLDDCAECGENFRNTDVHWKVGEARAAEPKDKQKAPKPCYSCQNHGFPIHGIVCQTCGWSACPTCGSNDKNAPIFDCLMQGIDDWHTGRD